MYCLKITQVVSTLWAQWAAWSSRGRSLPGTGTRSSRQHLPWGAQWRSHRGCWWTRGSTCWRRRPGFACPTGFGFRHLPSWQCRINRVKLPSLWARSTKNVLSEKDLLETRSYLEIWVNFTVGKKCNNSAPETCKRPFLWAESKKVKHLGHPGHPSQPVTAPVYRGPATHSFLLMLR